jgi:hypothetical protein
MMMMMMMMMIIIIITITTTATICVKRVSCHHGMARPRFADGGDGLPIWRAAAIVLNKQSRTADKRWPSNLGVGRRAKNTSPEKICLLRNVTKGLVLG